MAEFDVWSEGSIENCKRCCFRKKKRKLYS